MKPTAKVQSIDRTKGLMDSLRKIGRSQVYVGIPEDKSVRKDGSGPSNAQLLYIHTNGSPLKHIPPRPVIEPAIEAKDSKENISDELKQAAQNALAHKPGAATQHLRRAGMVGRNAAIRWFTDPRNGWPQNADSTIRRKLSKLKGKRRKDALAVLESGEDLDSINTPLVDKGEMRRAMTYIVKEDT